MTPRDGSAERSITYFRATAVTALVCGAGSGLIGALALSRADLSPVNLGLGLSLVVLSLVMILFSVACVQIASQLRGHAVRRQSGQPGRTETHGRPGPRA
jgi:hypothetical protein